MTAMGLCVLAIAVVTTGRAGQASAARAAALIEHADSPLPQPAPAR